jgi:predicted permease
LLENTLLVASRVAVLFLVMGAGVLAAKVRWLNGDGAKQLTNLVFYIATPCIIVNSFLSVKFTPELIGNILKTAAFAVAVHLFAILLSRFAVREDKPARRGIYRMCVVFSNCGYMGIPLASGVLGEECVVYVSVYIAVFQLFAWTFGISLYRPGEKMSLRAIFLNPGVLGLAAGLLLAGLFALTPQWSMPPLLGEPMELLASLNSPVAMIVLGYHLYVSPLRPQAGERNMWLAIAVRLLVMPAAALGISALLGLSGLWLSAALVLTSTPCATNVVLFAARYDRDAPHAAKVVSLCTLLSLLTMPVFLVLSLAANPLT